MGKTVALEGPSLEFAQKFFLEHYKFHPPAPPSRASEREFAYAPFSGGGMRRHLAIPSAEAFREMFVREVPRHAYYSSAYYSDPAHPIMISKKWEGADLIFDLDADHLQDAGGLSYPAQLELVRKKFRILVEDYLLKDFGLGEEDLTLAFSGGRGYHAHVHKDSFLSLSSAARRELVEYLGGSGVDLSKYLFPLEKAKVHLPKGTSRGPKAPSSGAAAEPAGSRSRSRAPSTTLQGIPKLPPPDAPGWEGRFTRAFFLLLDSWEGKSVAEVTNDILERGKRHGIAHLRSDQAFIVARSLFAEGKAKKAREKLVLDVGGKEKGEAKGVPIPFVEVVLAEGRVLFQGETDAPVTTDIHRLIRLPDSLHGGTGFRVRPLRLDELASFSPLRDAVLPVVPGAAPVRVRLVGAVDYPLGEDHVLGEEGEVLELPGPHALFLVLRGEATVDSAS
ncbi:MAG: hypothetical protein KGJ23_01005 [Euryarchaeota archaeon]|nr:hypothetical protein [Euryarchaeota archaeon]MDE1835175.1 hypothetical protein [Euryarchaeota archaeon]MDE1880414.1 hypothetical protein [Euryarchaeota archaeon]MDE2045717.1 hypothetical protein [Thermoplasmata archaeon]